MTAPHPIEMLRLQRINRLQRTVHVASWWLMGQGLLYCLLGTRSARWFMLRYDPEMVPYIDLAGVALLSLGLFINRAVREASKQYLAVDTLTLLFTGMSAMMVTHRFKGYPLNWFEWLSFLVNAGLGGALIAYRTKGTQMDAPGTLVALDIKDAWKQALNLAKGVRERKRQVDAPVVEAPAPIEAPTIVEAPPAPAAKPISEAMPHMD